ncbi:MAG: amidohydrolase family protein [Pseudomonadota bacterium]
MDLIVTNGTVLTMDDTLGVIENGAVGISRGEISWIGADRDCDKAGASRIFDARGGIIMPGLVNTFGNIGLRLFRPGALPEAGLSGNGETFPVLELNPETVRLGTSLACAEMMLSGTTCFHDRSRFAGDVAEAASRAGMRALCCQEVEIRDTGETAGDNRDRILSEDIVRFLEKWQDHPLIRVAVGPKDLIRCPEETLRDLVRLCRDKGMVMGVPIDETIMDAGRFPSQRGKTALAYLEDLELLGPWVLACHGVGLGMDDRGRLARHGCALVHTPLADLEKTSGVAPVPDICARGVCVCLGTGGSGKCYGLDLFCTMDITAKVHKVLTGDPQAAGARTVVEMATIRGAQALGLSGVTGSLTPGKRADLIVVSTAGLHMQPMYNPFSHLVYAASGHDVVLTVVDGTVVMADRTLTGMDLAQVMDRARTAGLFAFKGDDGEDFKSW